MSILKKMLEKRMDRDIRYVLFNAYLLITSLLGLIFAVVHLINRRPFVNIATGLIISAFAFGLHLLSTKYNKYTLVRRIFLIFMTFIYMPFGYWTSPGSYSAVLYLELLVIFMMTFIVVSTWEYIFPAIGVLISIFMLQTEIWYPDQYPLYTDSTVRIADISINFTIVVIAIMATIIYVVRQYNSYSDKLFEISITDPLTGLYNRRYVNSFIESEYNRSIRTKEPFSLVYLDLNNFKKVNDNYGHIEGDQVLKDIAEIIMNNIRNYDIAARYGGDEFIIILPKTDKSEAENNMTRLNDIFSEYSKKYNKAELSVAFGVADNTDKSLEEIFKIADQALYKRKNIQKGNL